MKTKAIIKYFIVNTIFLTMPLLSLGATTSVVLAQSRSATLALDPVSAKESYVAGTIFSLDVILDTRGSPIRGVDLRYLRYNPSLLEIQDDDASMAGAQVAAGTLMPNTVTNSVDTATGQITFSQVTNTGESFIGSGTLVTARFKALAEGTANVTFDFIPGNTADTNVASNGADILTAVTNGVYTLVPDSILPSTPKVFSAVAID